MANVKPVRNLFLRILRSKSVYVAAFALMLCAVGRSQSTVGSIDGIVADQSGAVLPNATVTVTNESTGLKRTVVTNGTGAYTVPNLPPGNYRAAIAAIGFAALHTELVVPINQTIRWDATLKTGGSSTTISVTDTTAHLETENHQLDETIGAQSIEDLPSNGRNLFAVLTYSANVTGYIGNDSNDVDYFHQQSNSLIVGGSVFGYTQMMQDGVANSNMLTRTANYQPSIEAVQEVSIVRDGGSARFDSPNAVNVVTKSGTNAFHGTVYDYLKNDWLDAIGPVKAAKPPLRYNQFGANVGGPILHNRLFFFIDYSGLRQLIDGVANGVVPTDAERNGDFSAFLPGTIIYDPAMYNPTTGTISSFTGNQIDPTRESDFAKQIFALIPHATKSNLTGTNWQETLPSTVNYDSYLGRLDYTIGRQDSVYGAFMTSDPVSTNGAIEPVFAVKNLSNASNAYIEETHVVNPHMVNLFHVGYNRSKVYNTVAGVGTEDFPKEFGLTALAGTPSTQWLPPGMSFTTGGYSGWNPSVQGATQNLFQYSDELTLTHGRHSIYAGAELDRIQFDGNWLLGNNGGFTFNGQYTSNHALKQSGGNSVADLFLGFPSVAKGAVGTSTASFRQYNVMPYIQDDWRLSNRLTLNLGIRYDFFGSPVDKNGHSNNYDVSTNTNHPGTFRQNYNNWGPRVGFAYGLTPTTVIRGGYGIYYAGIQYNELQFMVANLPNFFSENFTYTAAQAVPVQDTLTANPTSSVITPYTLALRMPTPYVQERNLSIQKSIQNSTVVEVAYIGSNASHIMRRINANQAYLPADPNNPASLQARRPYQWIGDVLEATDSAYANYNAVEVVSHSNFRNNSNLFGSVIFSKSLDDASSEQDVPQNIHNMGPEYGLSSFNRKYVVKVGGVTKLAVIGKHDAIFHTNHTWIDEAAGNWMLSGVVQVLAGYPFVETPTDLSNTGTIHPVRANRSCNGNIVPGGRTENEWFNTACFSQPDVYTFGTEPRNDLIGPRQTLTNLSTFKTFPFGETRSAIFRLDAFYALNHPILSAPTANLTNPRNGICGASGARVFQASVKIAF
jgi:hypothetical protein